jgi:hypothetical protein
MQYVTYKDAIAHDAEHKAPIQLLKNIQPSPYLLKKSDPLRSICCVKNTYLITLVSTRIVKELQGGNFVCF